MEGRGRERKKEKKKCVEGPLFFPFPFSLLTAQEGGREREVRLIKKNDPKLEKREGGGKKGKGCMGEAVAGR